MCKVAALLICLSGYCLAGPVGLKRNMPIVQQRNENAFMAETGNAANVDPDEMMIMSSLSLPSNATSIRADITDGFSCENKTYGYYADVDNDCQIFHVCLPVTYADGKENTFRWSFICPEETIFSQDAFTCMRPYDMTISCEESYQYYELNRNFGIVESAADKENSNEAGSANAESISEAEVVAEPAKPVVQHEEEKVMAQSKPVNVIKPSRRKPAIAYATQKRPTSSYPLRKIPQVQIQPQMTESPAIQISEDANEHIKPLEDEQIKPAVLKFSRRPVPAMSNSFKDKIQNPKTENVISTRTELFSQMRKRPTLFDKKPAEQPEEEKQVEQSKIESDDKQHNFSPVASDMPISNSDTQMVDPEIEASESNHVFVRPEDADETPQNVVNINKDAEEPIQVLEAFEEIPAVISEVVETSNAADEEETNKEENLNVGSEKLNIAVEPQITEETQSAEEVQSIEEIQTPEETSASQKAADETQTVVENQAAEETKNIEKTKTAEEVQTAQEITEVQQNLRTSAEETQIVDESEIAEDTKTDEKSAEADSSQAAEETQNTQEVEDAAENEKAEETKALVKNQMAEEIEAPEEIKTVEESQTVMESEAAEETAAAADKTETSNETQTAEEEIPEVHQSLRSSAEEIQNSEKTVAAEEIPNQTAEIVPAAVETEAAEETQIVEKSQSAENAQEIKHTPVDEEAQTFAETQLAQEVQNNDLESSEQEHIPDVSTQQDEESTHAEETLAVEEPQPAVHETEDSLISEEPASDEDSKPVEENVEPEEIPATEDADLVKAEVVNSEEVVSVAPVETIEQMESEKPAEAPELMQATEEMSHPNAMVQEMYENMDVRKQSAGEFKPVDPVMAQEAEQLIVDFINTLRKNDFTNETPGMNMDHHIDEMSEEEPSHKSAEVEETEKVESNEETQEAAIKIVEQEHKDETRDEISETQQSDTAEDNNEESQGVQEVEETKESDAGVDEGNDFNALKSLESQSTENMQESLHSEENLAQAMNLPQEMYQIPVQVINTPAEEMPMIEEQSHESKIEQAENTANAEERLPEESPAVPMTGYKPLSIDDIVELVKERLDHMPRKEMETPMQLEQVIEEAQEDKAGGEKFKEQSPVQAEEKQKQQTSQSEEDIVMPIYQRTVQPIQVEAGVQTENLEQVLNEEQSKPSADSVTDVKEKTKRSYRSRSVVTPTKDSRKRRFLFKADSS